MRIDLLLACCLASSACFTTTYVTKLPVGADHDVWHHNFVAGFVETGAPVDLREHCPEGVARVKSEVSFVNGLAAGAVNGAVSYGLDIAVQAAASDLNENVRTGIMVGYNFASALTNPIWSPSTLTITCPDRAAPRPGAPEAPAPPEPEPAANDGFNAFSSPATVELAGRNN